MRNSLRIIILGDFSGESFRYQPEGAPGQAAPARRKPLAVDRDNLDKVVSRLAPRLVLDLGGPPTVLRFSTLDDFAPDSIVRRMIEFDMLRETRARLLDPATFADACRLVQSWSTTLPDAEQTPTVAESGAQRNPPAMAAGEVLDALIAETRSRGSANALVGELADWRRMLASLVEPYLVQAPDPRQAELVQSVDHALSRLLRLVLHHPAFQALESAWRGIDFLVRRLETNEQLKLFLVDYSQAALAADLAATAGDETHDALYRLLEEAASNSYEGILHEGTSHEGERAILVGLYSFGPVEDEITALSRMARLAREVNAAFISAASPNLHGIGSLAAAQDPDGRHEAFDPAARKAWQALRGSPEAHFVGLAMPRFLLRLPYGRDTVPCDEFEFEEIADPQSNESFLWGNPALACALVLGRPGDTGDSQDIDGLPLFVDQADGESQLKPCTEKALSQREVLALLDEGLMPLVWMRNHDLVRLARLQSLDGDRGPWTVDREMGRTRRHGDAETR